MKKIICCYTLFFLFSIIYTNAQITFIDSLKQKLAAAKEDSIRVPLFVEVSYAYRNTSYLDSMVFYAQQAVFLSVQNKNSLPAGEEAGALSFLADALWYAGNYPDAKESYFMALEKAEPTGDSMLMATIYNGLAIVNRNEGNYRQAIHYYSKAEALVKHIPDNDALFSALADKGKPYEQLGILDSAFTYTQECLAILVRKYQDKNVLGAVFMQTWESYILRWAKKNWLRNISGFHFN